MTETLEKPIEAEKPRLRGLIHLIMSPVSLVAGLVLVALADKLRGRIALGIFTLAAVTLFTGSALYHRVGWKPKTKEVWRRIDHANITVLIAGTYTPFAIFLLDKTQAIVLLSIVWAGALAQRSALALRTSLYIARLGRGLLLAGVLAQRRRRRVPLNCIGWPLLLTRWVDLRRQEAKLFSYLVRFP